jgi:sporulation protein YlmC with PRC-barrel domain
METREAHVEHLLGRKVRDERGRELGRIEEMIVEVVDDEYVVTEFHLGTGAVIERITGFVRQLPFFRLLPGAKEPVRVGWKEMDLSDPWNPVVRRPG